MTAAPLERIRMISEHEWQVRDQINAEINKALRYLEDSGWLPPHEDDHPEHECLVCWNVLVPLSSAAYVGIDWEEEGIY
jgi:hypothetical protein